MNHDFGKCDPAILMIEKGGRERREGGRREMEKEREREEGKGKGKGKERERKKTVKELIN